MSPTPISRQFARFATTLPVVSKEVLRAADRAMFDTLGAMLAGGAHASVQAVAQASSLQCGPCTLAVGGSSDVATAALINGMAAHVWDIDDTSYTGIMHGSAVVFPTVLALAQQTGADADKLRRAFIAGSEVTYVLADICTHTHYFHGWWSTVTFSLIGATAAAGVLLDLDEDSMTSAIGLAAAAAGGGKAVFGTDAKPFLVGEAAQRAIQFATMAQAGLRGPENAFEDDRGYLKLLNNAQADLTAISSLGQRWRLVDPGLLFKTSPVCSAAHAAIDQMADLMEASGADPEDITEILVEVPELVHVSLVYPNPQSPQEAQFSLTYALACTALTGRVTFADLLPDALKDPAKKSLMAKIVARPVEELSTDEMRRKFPESARITLTLRGDKTVSGFCGSAYGMPDRPLSDTDLAQKFSRALTFANWPEVGATVDGFDPLHVFKMSVSAENNNQPTGRTEI